MILIIQRTNQADQTFVPTTLTTHTHTTEQKKTTKIGLKVQISPYVILVCVELVSFPNTNPHPTLAHPQLQWTS